jgi:hypothetical protein
MFKTLSHKANAIKMTLKFHLTLDRKTVIKKKTTNAGERVGKEEPLYTAGRDANWCNHYGNQYGVSSKKVKIELPDDLTIQLLGMYPKECKSVYNKYTLTPMLIVAFFSVPKLWIQPTYQSLMNG